MGRRRGCRCFCHSLKLQLRHYFPIAGYDSASCTCTGMPGRHAANSHGILQFVPTKPNARDLMTASVRVLRGAHSQLNLQWANG